MLIDANRWVRLLLFVPAFIMAIGYLQAKNRFCVGYGAAGMQNAEAGSETATHIEDQVAVAQDKKRARQMNLHAAGLAVVAVALALLFP